MKKLTTIFCCFAFMIFGASIALKELSITPNTQTVMASPPVFYNTGKLPLDLQLDLEKRTKKDTIVIRDTTVIHDTVKVCKPIRKRVPKLVRVTDTLYHTMFIPGHIPGISVLKQNSGDREENTQGTLFGPKSSNIILTVDGRVVYKTGNDIHSTGGKQ